MLIRRMQAVETLGAVQTICLDKTGTLTVNRMSVVTILCDDVAFELVAGRYRIAGAPVDPASRPTLRCLLEIAVLCNESEIDEKDGRAVFTGTPTENALMLAAVDAGIDIATLRRDQPRLDVSYRNEHRRFMSTVHRIDGERCVVAVKGSPAEVLLRSEWQLIDGVRRPLTNSMREAVLTLNERMAGEALRVLGFAYRDASGAAATDDGLTWLGLIGMTDPVRPGVKSTIAQFHQAGIDTVMITGDQSATAYAIAKELNLGRGAQIQILDSTNLEKLPPDALSALARRAHAFARVSPSNKLEVVRALQQSGQVVAMTGDGVNDSPALKAADIGVAMGRSGTEVARDVADVVLEDDRLETMVSAIARGRTIYGNARKSIRFLLATNLSEIMIMLAGTAGGLGQPLNPMQLLWINIATDVFPAIALSLDPPHPDVLKEPPRDPDEPIVRRHDFFGLTRDALIISAGSLGAYAFGVSRYGIGPRASTTACLSLVTSQLLYARSCRRDAPSRPETAARPPNRLLTLAIGATFAAQGLVAVLPPLRRMFGFAPIGPLDGMVAMAGGLLPLVAIEAIHRMPPLRPERIAATTARATEAQSRKWALQ